MTSKLRGIYKLTIKDKFYYGSAVDFRGRRKTHLYHLVKGDHFNKRIQNLYNKGYDMIFDLIEEVPDDVDLYDVEQGYINEHFGKDYCINLSEVAGGGKLYERTSEHAQKMIATKTRNNSFRGANENSWAAAAKANTGCTRSDECREKMSIAAKKRDPATLIERQEKGRQNMIENMRKFSLVKDNKIVSEYKFFRDVDFLSDVSLSNLKTGRKSQVKGYSMIIEIK